MGLSLWVDTFCADISTAQRNKSMNRLVKTLIYQKKLLSFFFKYLERVFED